MAGPVSPANPARPAPATKAARQARIVAILSREQVHSQEQLASLLGQYADMHVTQATLSRDLDELGVVRLRAADGALVYALPGDPGGHGSPAGTAFDYPERVRPVSDPPIPAPSALRAAVVAQGTRAPGTTGGTSGQVTDSGTGSSGAEGEQPPSHGTDGTDSGSPAPATQGLVGLPSGAAASRLIRYLKELLTSAEASANLVVLRTPAGAAQFLASAIDHTAWSAILGTVAGDDTVLVIARDPAGGNALAAEFLNLADRRR